MRKILELYGCLAVIVMSLYQYLKPVSEGSLDYSFPQLLYVHSCPVVPYIVHCLFHCTKCNSDSPNISQDLYNTCPRIATHISSPVSEYLRKPKYSISGPLWLYLWLYTHRYMYMYTCTHYGLEWNRCSVCTCPQIFCSENFCWCHDINTTKFSKFFSLQRFLLYCIHPPYPCCLSEFQISILHSHVDSAFQHTTLYSFITDNRICGHSTPNRIKLCTHKPGFFTKGGHRDIPPEIW